MTAGRLEETICSLSDGPGTAGGDKAAFMELLEQMKGQLAGARGKITFYGDGSLIPIDLAEIVNGRTSSSFFHAAKGPFEPLDFRCHICYIT